MTNYDPVKLEAFVQQRAPQIAQDIRNAAEKAHNEADLVAETEKILEKFSNNFDIQLKLQRERTLINGRADAVYNRFVIEYEPPRSLTKNNSHRNNKHAIEQVQNYMGGLERVDRQKKERLAGAVLDGSFFIFVRYRDEHWHIDDPIPVSAHSTETFLRYLLALSTELALTPENLVRDFGENSNVARRVVPALYAAITSTENKKADVLFRQWLRQFQEVSGYDPNGSQLNAKELGKLYAVSGKTINLEKMFFCIHTYYAAFIKLLALQVGYYYLMPKMGSGLKGAADDSSEKVCKFLQNMERGGLFAELGIKNFLEGDFFGWYLDIWDDSLFAAFQRLIGDLANYSLVTLDVDPEETRDLLKQLYQNLVPRELRHALGEYYTPDWLAERLLNQLGYEGDPKIRLLDPACGSGTFLVLAIKRVHAWAEEKMLPSAQVLDQILQNIVGFDLNPLAVISSRTNYLLALGDLLQHRNGEINIPVFLADSILTPAQGTDLFTQNAYSFATAVGKFSIPRVLVQANYISQLADLLEECVHVNLDPTIFEQRLINSFGLKRPEDGDAISITTSLYIRLVELEEQGINGIWARIIKNAFAPLFQPKFDLVAGNPPWVNWESLPKDYRSDTIPLWQKHSLFTHKGYEAMLGKSKDDISILMTYISIDKYLVFSGKIGFVITQSIFKTGGAGDGFRNLKLGDGTLLKVEIVDDFSTLKPFEGAANKTSIVIITKGIKNRYPVSYSKWYKPNGSKAISENLTLNEIIQNREATYYQYVAYPINKNKANSAWITGRKNALEAIQRLIGESYYSARSGVCTWLNGVYWINVIQKEQDSVIISNLGEVGRKKVEVIQTVIEPDLLYELIRGRDVRRWRFTSSAQIIIPHYKSMGLTAIDENILAQDYPKTYSYFNYFKKELLGRAGLKKYFSSEAPFYSLFNIGNYTFAPYKVAWAREDNELRATVIGGGESQHTDNLFIPDQSLQFIPIENEDEAHFICALLNSSIANFIALSFTSDITTRIMTSIPVPKYLPNNINHKNLSNLSKKLHYENDLDDEYLIDELSCFLWGIKKNEYDSIINNLKEIL